MSVRDFHPEHRNPYALARDGGLHSDSHLAGKSPELPVEFRLQIENVIVLDVLGDYQSMALCKRVNIQKGVEPVVLRHFEGRNLSLGYFCEYCHLRC